MTENEIAGRVACIRKLGGIVFAEVSKSAGVATTIVFDRHQMPPNEFDVVRRLHRKDWCRVLTIQRGRDTIGVRVLSHYVCRQNVWTISDEQRQIVGAYACLLNEVRSFFQRHGYLEVRLPTIHIGKTKAAHFALDFFGAPARLSSSNALYADAYALQLGPVYSIQRCFRAEKSHTRKHLSEFDMLEVAIPDAKLTVAMTVLEQLIKYVALRLSQSWVGSLLHVDPNTLMTRSFRCVTYNTIASRLGLKGRGLGKWEEDIADDGPVFVINFPQGIASWAAERVDAEHTASFNLLLPKVGEVAEGAQRLHDVDLWARKIRASGTWSQLAWYVNAMVYPGCRTSGFGLGLERLGMWLFSLRNIRQVHLIYRDVKFSEIGGQCTK